MIDKDKTKIMIGLAKIENNRLAKKAFRNIRAGRGDYLIQQGVISFVIGTLFFIILCSMIAILNLEAWTFTLFSEKLFHLIRKLTTIYIIYIIISVGISLMIHNYHYTRYRQIYNKYILLQERLFDYYQYKDGGSNY